MRTVIYKSQTGNTKKYAGMLGNKLNVSVYEADEAKKHLKKGDEVIYLGWLCAGSIKGFEKARKRYKISAVCAVGMPRKDDKQYQSIKDRHKLSDIPLFYLQGGLDMSKLKGMSKFGMNMVKKVMISSIAKKEQKTEEDEETLDMLEHGRVYVNEENLNGILAYFRKENQ